MGVKKPYWRPAVKSVSFTITGRVTQSPVFQQLPPRTALGRQIRAAFSNPHVDCDCLSCRWFELFDNGRHVQ